MKNAESKAGLRKWLDSTSKLTDSRGGTHGGRDSLDTGMSDLRKEPENTQLKTFVRSLVMKRSITTHAKNKEKKKADEQAKE